MAFVLGCKLFFISIFLCQISYDVSIISSFVVDPGFKNNLGANSGYSEKRILTKVVETDN